MFRSIGAIARGSALLARWDSPSWIVRARGLFVYVHARLTVIPLQRTGYTLVGRRAIESTLMVGNRPLKRTLREAMRKQSQPRSFLSAAAGQGRGFRNMG